ncbi:helix-turn-helix domain-containing protein [Treponema sp. R80B11-R83G3]
MESLGEKLRTTREEKGLTIDQISRETNIAVRYLEALEAENFGIFPGEPYLIGFIKNYGSYLELDNQKLISLYRALRIQEQPIPVEQLLKNPPRLPKFIIPTVIILAILCGGGWLARTIIINRQNNPIHDKPVSQTSAEYIMEGNSMKRRLYKNDTVLISVDNETYKLELYNMGEAVTIRTPAGQEILDLSQEITIDLNNDGIPELRVTLIDFAKNKADMGALLDFYLMDAAAYTGSEPEKKVSRTDNTVTAASTTIFPASVSAYPFTLQISFQGYCMFRWEILNERDRRGSTQRYFQRSEVLDIQAQNGIRIWLSNAQSTKLQVIGGGRVVPAEIGSAGEVVVAEIRWVRDDENRYRLVLMRLEL